LFSENPGFKSQPTAWLSWFDSFHDFCSIPPGKGCDVASY